MEGMKKDYVPGGLSNICKRIWGTIIHGTVTVPLCSRIQSHLYVGLLNNFFRNPKCINIQQPKNFRNTRSMILLSSAPLFISLTDCPDNRQKSVWQTYYRRWTNFLDTIYIQCMIKKKLDSRYQATMRTSMGLISVREDQLYIQRFSLQKKFSKSLCSSHGGFRVPVKMDFEQRTNIKFCFSLRKMFVETFQMMKTVWSDDVKCSTVHLWYKRFKVDRRSIQDDPKSGRPVTARDLDHIFRVRELVKAHPHCKSLGQVSGAAWPSSLAKQFKSPGSRVALSLQTRPIGFVHRYTLEQRDTGRAI